MLGVIILEIPKRCEECKLRHVGYCKKKRRRGCPITALPYKMSPPTYRDYEAYKEGEAFTAGWNACIDRIEGEDRWKIITQNVSQPPKGTQKSRG